MISEVFTEIITEIVFHEVFSARSKMVGMTKNDVSSAIKPYRIMI